MFKKAFTLKKEILYFILFCSSYCIGQVQPLNGLYKNKKNSFDTILPQNPKIDEKIYMEEPYHNYDKVQLTRSGGYYSLREGAREIINEVYPGILVYKHKSGELGSTYWKIEFYDVQSKILIRAVNLEDDTPYNREKYENIDFGLYGGEDAGHKSPPLPDSNCMYPKLPNPNNYLTNTYYSVSPGGHIFVRYELYGLYDSLFVSFENTSVIFDRKGNKVWKTTRLNDTSSPYVTSDGKYLCYIYGTHTSDNFFDACQGSVEIINLKTNEKRLHYVFDKNEKITSMFEAEKNGQLIIQARNASDGMYVNKVVIIDLANPSFFERSFSKKEWNDVVKNWVSYEKLKNEYSFNFKKI